MAWKKYKDKSPEEKKKSWEGFRASQRMKQMAGKVKYEDKHPAGHKADPNPGGYCRTCGYGRDHS